MYDVIEMNGMLVRNLLLYSILLCAFYFVNNVAVFYSNFVSFSVFLKIICVFITISSYIVTIYTCLLKKREATLRLF